MVLVKHRKQGLNFNLCGLLLQVEEDEPEMFQPAVVGRGRQPMVSSSSKVASKKLGQFKSMALFMLPMTIHFMFLFLFTITQ